MRLPQFLATGALAVAAFAAQAERVDAAKLPESVSVGTLAPANGQRIYLSDPAMGHLVDGRMHVVDAAAMS